jgi:hypothetical protein
VLCVFFYTTTSSAFADPAGEPDHMVLFAVGLGYTFTEVVNHEGEGSGAFLEAEYVFRPTSFFTPRLYAGSLVTFPDEDSCGVEPCDVKSQIFFLGAKARLMAPIPYIGPFIELGLGLSLGHLRTLDQDVDEEMSGATVHIPIAVGLALGRENNFSVSFSYLHHPSDSQLSGAVAVGMGFRIP